MRRVSGLDAGVAAAASIAIDSALLSQPHLPDWFARFFGPAPPALCIAGLGVVALLVAPMLKRRAWWGTLRIEALLVVPLLVAGFASFITAVDLLLGFPPDLNAPPPWSLLYYPAMGFAAQVGLHLVPLIAIIAFAPGLARVPQWATAAVASAPETALQVWSEDGATAALVAPHLIAFGVAELYLLRRFGFIAMYAFRMTYYLYWHVLWPAWRAG